MPELPEVQTVVESLNQQPLIGKSVTAARVYWPKTIAGLTPAQFRKRIRGCSILQITRRGKYIVFQLSHGLTLLIHLRMTGRLIWTARSQPRNRHEQVVLEVHEQNELRFQDTRKFGRIFLTDTPETILGPLGPEPLAADFTSQRLIGMLQAKRGRLKPLLLNQRFLAGLGNIYVDEALWEAHLHPQQLVHRLSEKEIQVLHQAIVQVLQTGLENRGTSLGAGQGNFHSLDHRPGRNADQLKVFRRTGQACPRCNTVIARIIVAQRSTHLCPHCQPQPLCCKG